MNNKRPTPETDAQGFGDGRHPWVGTDFARKLERERDSYAAKLVASEAYEAGLLAERDEARELARELRDALQRASNLLEQAGIEQGTTWEPGQSWIFHEDKCAAKNDVEAIRAALIKAKEALL